MWAAFYIRGQHFILYSARNVWLFDLTILEAIAICRASVAIRSVSGKRHVNSIKKHGRAHRVGGGGRGVIPEKNHRKKSKVINYERFFVFFVVSNHNLFCHFRRFKFLSFSCYVKGSLVTPTDSARKTQGAFRADRNKPRGNKNTNLISDHAYPDTSI